MASLNRAINAGSTFCGAQVDGVFSDADGGAVTTQEAIERLLGAQITLHNNRRLQAAMRSSHLPAVKTLDSFQLSIKYEQIDSLHEFSFVGREENVVLLGPPGVGKTHLTISLAIAAAQKGRRVYYGTLAELINSLEQARAARSLNQRLMMLSHPSLFVVDETGYLLVTQTGAMLFFQLISRRYEHASTMLTSNKSFEEWAAVMGDEVMAAALIDRILHHGNSYRMRQHTELWKALHSAGLATPRTLHKRRRKPPEVTTS